MTPDGARTGAPTRLLDRNVAVLVVLTACALAWPMYWNGFPLVFNDTGVYIASALEHYVPWDRPIFYSVFLAVAGKAASLYAAVLVQSLLAAYVIVMFHRAFTERDTALAPLWPLSILAIATPLPWLVSWLIPDFPAGLAILILFMFLFLRHKLDRATSIVLAGVLYFALVTHTGTFLVSVLALPLLLAIGWAARRTFSRRGLVEVLVVAVAGYLSLAGVNAIAYKRWTINVGSQAFLLNRLIGSGLMQPYLAKACEREPDLLLCPYREEINGLVGTDDFLWGKGQLAFRTGATLTNAVEARALVVQTVADSPWQVAAVMVRDAARQFAMAGTPCGSASSSGDCFAPYEEGEYVQTRLEAHYSQAFEKSLASRQQRSELGYSSFLPVHKVVFWLFLVATLGVLILGQRRGDRLVMVLAMYVLCVLALNAFVHGSLSGPVPRYQAKLGWLVVLVAVSCMQRLSARGRPLLSGGRASGAESL
jgi:hypothetical protein